MRPLALLAALALPLAACDSAGPSEYAEPESASATDVAFLRAETARLAGGGVELAFRYAGRTPSPCHALAGYGSSYTEGPAPVRVEVHVDVEDRAEGPCAAGSGAVEVGELFVPVPRPGVYEVAFERPGRAPIVKRLRVGGAEAVEE